MQELLENIRLALQEQADERVRMNSLRFFKEKIQAYGVASAEVNTIARRILPPIKKQPKQWKLDLCEEL